jgi:hypothetical protein
MEQAVMCVVHVAKSNKYNEGTSVIVSDIDVLHILDVFRRFNSHKTDRETSRLRWNPNFYVCTLLANHELD